MFKNFRKRRDRGTEVTAANLVQQLVARLEADRSLAKTVPVELRAQLQELLPVEIKQVLMDRFEFDLAYAMAQRLHKSLQQRFGLLESRWPNMHQHVIGYRDLVRMIEEYLKNHPEVADVACA